MASKFSPNSNDKTIRIPPLKKVTFYGPVELRNSNKKSIQSRPFSQNRAAMFHNIEAEQSCSLKPNTSQRVLISRTRDTSNHIIIDSGKLPVTKFSCINEKSVKTKHKKVMADGNQIKTIMRCNHLDDIPVWGGIDAMRGLEKTAYKVKDDEIRSKKIEQKIERLLLDNKRGNRKLHQPAVASNGRRLLPIKFNNKENKDSQFSSIGNIKKVPQNIHKETTGYNNSWANPVQSQIIDQNTQSTDVAYSNMKSRYDDPYCRFCKETSKEIPVPQSSEDEQCPGCIRQPFVVHTNPGCCQFCGKNEVQLRECCHCCIKKKCPLTHCTYQSQTPSPDISNDAQQSPRRKSLRSSKKGIHNPPYSFPCQGRRTHHQDYTQQYYVNNRQCLEPNRADLQRERVNTAEKRMRCCDHQESSKLGTRAGAGRITDSVSSDELDGRQSVSFVRPTTNTRINTVKRIKRDSKNSMALLDHV